MEFIDLIVDFFKDNLRQGPGSEEISLITLSEINNLNSDSKILELGCGTGNSALLLADKIGCEVTAVDIFPEFLEVLENKINSSDKQLKIKTLVASFDKLDFYEEFDLIWSEGAIYNIGFENGINLWKNYLKKGGFIAISDLSFLTEDRPQELTDYWQNNYSEAIYYKEKNNILENAGFELINNIILPEHCWIENYYEQISNRFEEFAIKHNNCDLVNEFIKSEQFEIDLYNKFKQYYGYVFYVACKC